MSRYLLIQHKLEQIDDASFQTICNTYLSYYYPGDLQSTGSVVGKKKVKIGKPDAYIRTSAEKYVLAEHTTRSKLQKAQFLEKLHSDLDDLMNYRSLKLLKADIQKIVLCCNAVVDLPDQQSLLKRTRKKGLSLRVVGIETLTEYLFREGSDFARDFLSIPYDTGQFLKKAEFLAQYSRSPIATSLDNSLIGRTDDISQLLELIDEQEIVILSGHAGIGKTRLALDVIDQFCGSHQHFISYYMISNSHPIIDDLHSYLENEKDYILFIDDANRQIEILLPLLYKQVERKRGTIKLILTVRDHLKPVVFKVFRERRAIEYPVHKVTDEVIFKIIDNISPGLKASLRDKIISICKGNARVVMMALSVIRKHGQHVNFNDISTVFEEYFDLVRNENEKLNDIAILRILGVTAFLNTVDFTQDSERELIKIFSIDPDEFVDEVRRLYQLEIITLYSDSVVKVSDQLLASYFFYLVFFKEKLIPFQFLLDHLLERYPERMRDSFWGVNEIFSNQKVFDKIESQLRRYWFDGQRTDHQKEIFVSIFGSLYPSFTFSFLSGFIEKLEVFSAEAGAYFERNISPQHHVSYDKVLVMLDPNYYSEKESDVATALELSLKYAEGILELLDSYCKD